jgi:hypothetical protein
MAQSARKNVTPRSSVTRKGFRAVIQAQPIIITHSRKADNTNPLSGNQKTGDRKQRLHLNPVIPAKAGIHWLYPERENNFSGSGYTGMTGFQLVTHRSDVTRDK